MERLHFSELPCDLKMAAISQMADAKHITEDECFHLIGYTEYRPGDEFTFDMQDSATVIVTPRGEC